MGWGRWLLLGDLGQQMDIADQQAEIEKLKDQLHSRHRPSTAVDRQLTTLQRENDELKLYLAAIIRLLLARKVATLEEVKAMVTAVDREDGVEDDRFTGSLLPNKDPDGH
jgi:hypothetical protein